MMTQLSHSPLDWFSKRYADSDKAALVILNCKLYGLECIVKKFWDHYAVIACADGGSNILYDLTDQGDSRYIPNFVCGDMDSARKKVLEFYKEKGCPIFQCMDQDTTDFTKTLQHLFDMKESGKFQFSSVYAINGMGGRFDQTLANINTLYSINTGGVPLYLMSEDSLLFVLEPGEHKIYVDSNLEEGHCGLVPLGEPCSSCTTSGLKWNLDEHTMKFGDLISTNNLLNEKIITIKNSSRLIWTMSHTLTEELCQII